MLMRLTLFAICLALAAGCSKKKEEAELLEEEVQAQEEPLMPPGADTTVPGTAEPMPEETVSEAVEPEMPEPGYLEAEPSGFAVQVASCPSREYADYLVELYTSRGYEPYLTTIEIDGEVYYRVRIGGFETPGQARALKAEIEDRYSVDAWVDRTE